MALGAASVSRRAMLWWSLEQATLRVMSIETEIQCVTSPLAEGLSFSDCLPSTITQCADPSPLAERMRMNDLNFSLLKPHALEDFQR